MSNGIDFGITESHKTGVFETSVSPQGSVGFGVDLNIGNIKFETTTNHYKISSNAFHFVSNNGGVKFGHEAVFVISKENFNTLKLIFEVGALMSNRAPSPVYSAP